MPINNGIINQKGTPAFFSDIFANRPAFGYAGRVFISTDTGAIYEDTGTAWTLIADAGAGTTGTLQQVTTNGNTTTLGVTIQGININDGAGTGLNNIVIGGGLQSNTTGTQNTAIGIDSLVINTTGFNNTALGGTTLNNNTTGNYNSAIGYSSLQANTTGQYNTSIGESTLATQTTANNNTAVGSAALTANTTGTPNTAVGRLSLATNTTGGSNTAVGSNSLQNNTTGNNNTAIGVSSLAANTTASSNTAIGATSLQLNTTGASNTAVGYQSLNANTTGASNTAIGVSALSGNTTATGNTAIGFSSLLNNTTGVNNNALGYNSLRLNTTGGNNVALGTNALQSNTTASDNTAIGNNSLNANTTGTQNTAIGGSTLIVNTTGFGNSAMGYGTMASNTTGQLNIGIGGGSLAANTTGNNNTAIGSFAGSLITTGSNNTILGYYQGTPTLASNIVLADGLGNVRLFSDANGLIGIGQAVGTPGGQLDIHTTQTYALVLNGLTTNNAYTAFSNNSVGKWRIGNTYNAGANSFDIHNLGTSSNAVRFFSANNYAYFGSLPSSVVYMRYNFNVGTDLNIGFRSDSSRCRIEATNDAVSANIPIDFIGSVYSFGNAANVLINSFVDDTINKLQVNGSIKNIGNLTNTSSNFQSFGSSSFAASTWGISIGNGSVSANYVKANDNFFQNGAGTQTFYINTSGVVQITNLAGTGSRAVLADASGNLSAPVSDISVKENINTIGYGLNEILKMNPVWFNYNDEYKNYGEGRQNGNIAQEMEKVIPEAVFITPSTGKMGINYDQLHAVYIKAIQELKAEIDALKNN